MPVASVTRGRMASRTTSEGITPPSSLLRAHAPNPFPPPDFVYPHVCPSVRAGCCEPLLGTGSSRRYLRNSFLRCLVLNPDGPTECTCLFLPRRHRPSLDPSQVGFPLLPRTRFSAVRFRGCRRTFLAFKPPSLLVSQIAPTAANFAGRPRLVLPGRTCFVASARTGYAIRLIQAIDGERTFTFPDLRPCRLLQGPTLISRVVVQPNSFFQLSSCSWRTQVGLPVSFCTPRRVPARHRSTRRTC